MRSTLPHAQGYFNPRTPCGVRLYNWAELPPIIQFQSTHPVRGATFAEREQSIDDAISIHAPRAGCDLTSPQSKTAAVHFNPRTPCGVRLSICCQRLSMFQNFNPRTPCGVRQNSQSSNGRCRANFNPRTPCGVRLQKSQKALREYCNFNPRTPCGVRRRHGGCWIYKDRISIHAPRAGCDIINHSKLLFAKKHFNPRTPCGVRPIRCADR